ncbi:MAG: FG-GAP repeat protein, partial [candidate division Zixibacteria bacterium]|nr:FG-GAP repeat protein [candidate division Zixibacteria bacterium]
TLTGAADNNMFGGSVACGDVNGDGYDDLLIGSPGFDSNKGRAYLVAGAATFANHDFSVDPATAVYTGATAGDRIGVPSCIPGDVNGDGFDDMFVTYPGTAIDGITNRGRGYLFLGASSPASVDLGSGSSDAMYTGAVPSAGEPYLLGYCKPIGDVNADSIDDLFMGAPLAPVGGTSRGQAFVIFGSTDGLSSIDFTSESADVTISGAEDQDMLLVSPAAL